LTDQAFSTQNNGKFIVRQNFNLKRRLLKMKHFIFIGVWLVLFSAAVQAETIYVSDLAEIAIRSGQGVDHKIIAMTKSGQQVEVLETNDQWTKIRLPDGKEGWVNNRFLTSKLPCIIELEELKKKYETLKSKSPDLVKVQADYQRAVAELDKQTKRAEKLEEDLSKFETRQHIRWFISGAAVLFVGFLIGFSTKSQRRRSSLL